MDSKVLWATFWALKILGLNIEECRHRWVSTFCTTTKIVWPCYYSL